MEYVPTRLVALLLVTEKFTVAALLPIFAKLLSMPLLTIDIEKELVLASNALVDLIVCLVEVPSLISY